MQPPHPCEICGEDKYGLSWQDNPYYDTLYDILVRVWICGGCYTDLGREADKEIEDESGKS